MSSRARGKGGGEADAFVNEGRNASDGPYTKMG